MSEKVGKNIMSWAKWIAVVEVIAGIVMAIILWVNTEEFLPGFWAILGCFAAVVSCWPLYGFGMLINDVHAMRVRGSAAAAPVDEEAADELPDL